MNEWDDEADEPVELALTIKAHHDLALIEALDTGG